MTFYLLLNLALIVVAAGIIPVFASGDEDDSSETTATSTASANQRAAQKAAQTEQRLLTTLIEETVQALRTQVKTQINLNVELDHTKTASEQNLQLLQSELSILKNVLIEAQRSGKVNDEKLAALKEQVAQLDLQKKALEASTSAADRFGESFDALLGISDKWTNSLVGGLVDSVTQGASLDQTLSAIGQKMKKNLSPLRLMGNLVTKMQDATKDLAVAQDKAMTSVNKSTQAYGKYDNQIASINIEHRSQGASLEKISSAYIALNNTLSIFDTLQSETQKKLATTSAYLQTLGADVGVVAETLKLATSNLGMTADSADMLTRETADLASALGQDLNKTLGDLNTAMPFVAMYGDGARDAFRDLAVAADGLQMSMSQVISLVEKFQTFEDAATSAGRLNAALGGDFVNSVSLLKASYEDPVDVLRQLREGIEATGQSLDSMNSAQRKMIAEAAGLSSVGELAMLMNGELEQAQVQTEANALSMEELAKRTKATREIGDIWNDTLQLLAVNLLPIVKSLKAFIGGMSDLAHEINKILEPIGGLATILVPLAIIFGAILFVILPLAAAFAILTPALTAFGLSAPAASAGIAVFGGTLGGLAPVLVVAAKGLAFFGLGLGVTALGLAAVALAFGSITSSFKSLGDLGDIPALSKLGGWAIDLAKFGTVANTEAASILKLSTALSNLKGSMEGVNLTSLTPFTETIKAVVELEKLETGIPITEKLIEQVGEVRMATTPPTPAAATTKAKGQPTFPSTVNLVIQTKGGPVSFPAFIEPIAKKAALAAVAQRVSNRHRGAQ